MLAAAIVTVTHRVLANTDMVIIGIYFAIIFGIGLYFAKKGRTSEDYFLAGRNIGWFAIGASLFVSNISTEHFIGLAGSGAYLRTGGGRFRVAGVHDAAVARMGVRAVLSALQRVYHAGISRAPLQSQLRHVSRQHFGNRLYFHENFRASLCRGHRAGACRWLEPVDGGNHSGHRHRHLHHCRRAGGGDLYRPGADTDSSGWRHRPHVDRHG